MSKKNIDEVTSKEFEIKRGSINWVLISACVFIASFFVLDTQDEWVAVGFTVPFVILLLMLAKAVNFYVSLKEDSTNAIIMAIKESKY